jgi:hypothetical protein
MHSINILCVMTCWHHFLSVDLRSCAMMCYNNPEHILPSPYCRNQHQYFAWRWMHLAVQHIQRPCRPFRCDSTSPRLCSPASRQQASPVRPAARSRLMGGMTI